VRIQGQSSTSLRERILQIIQNMVTGPKSAASSGWWIVLAGAARRWNRGTNASRRSGTGA
jgi:hypothetical protein